MTDEEILALTENPETRETGFRWLVTTYQQRLYRVIRRRVSSHEDADDILQNTFIKVFRYLEGYERRAELFTWMYRIATNEVMNYLKKQKRTVTHPLPEEDHSTADHFMDTARLELHFEHAINKLPERQQMVFRMRYFDELSYKEMADMLEVSEGALKASFHHAARKIGEELKAKQII
jgi:RNA polymerase sigma-70 factor (ECF subfamily)